MLDRQVSRPYLSPASSPYCSCCRSGKRWYEVYCSSVAIFLTSSASGVSSFVAEMPRDKFALMTNPLPGSHSTMPTQFLDSDG